ncbi:PREDICTED: olfactory receptor 1496-like [Nanorana parkeri]|uniref:olfactory receptor 1496-like n=1 Tax=Nanorana parkeri TaxID=125878 RepID=UPI000853F619|nr:PREDICTED: olfactory receptor 1496-like [Nanorana parkeri]
MEEFTLQHLPDIRNDSSIENVFIVGLRIHQSYRLVLFGLFLVTYAMTLTCNLLIILLVSFSKLSHSPMYVFLSNLSLAEILLTTNIVPPMLHVLLRNGIYFSLIGCFTQLFLFGVFLVTESFLLSAMSYDRFLAICKPLHYRLIMGPGLCICLILVCWALPTLLMSIALGFVTTLDFCRDNIIDHFYCDVIPILKLSCSDTSSVEILVSSLSSAASVFPLHVIIATYGFIIRAINKISSSKGKEKAFSTCSSHLGVVSTYYATMIMVYVVPPGHFVIMNKVLSLLYSVITPLVNPFIYTLRNQDINAAIRQTLTSLTRP